MRFLNNRIDEQALKLGWINQPFAESNSLGGLGIYTEMTVGELFYEQYNEYLVTLIPKSIDYSFHLNLVMPNFYFSKEALQMASSYMKRCASLLFGHTV